VSDGEDKRGPTAFTGADPPRNFTLTAEERIRAITIGVPAYAARKRKIEDREAEMLGKLLALRDELAATGAGEERVTQAVESAARALDLGKLNTLVETHNRYYPIEANLRIDPRTGGYLVFGRPWTPEPAWTVERLLARLAQTLSERG
jgi:hypothetical protein